MSGDWSQDIFYWALIAAGVILVPLVVLDFWNVSSLEWQRRRYKKALLREKARRIEAEKKDDES